MFWQGLSFWYDNYGLWPWQAKPRPKTEKGLPLQAIISMMNNHNLFLCHPAVLGSRNLAICFLSQLFYSHFDIVKIWRQHCFQFCLTTRWRIQRLMTQFIDRSVVVIGRSIKCNRTAMHYKRLSSVMNREADSYPEKQGSKPGRASFFSMDPF